MSVSGPEWTRPECLDATAKMQREICILHMGYISFFFLLQTIWHRAYSASQCNAPLHYIYTYTHRHTPALNNDFSHSSAISPVRARCKEKRRMILSHMRYNSPVDSSTEQGDRGTEGRQREAGGGCLSVTSLSGKKKKAKTRGFFFAVANSFQSVKRAFLSA